METRKTHHLESLENSSYTRVDVIGRHILGIFYDAKHGEGGESCCLPEGKEDDGFDRNQLEKRLLGGQLLGDGDIELDQAVHSDGNGYGDDNRDIYVSPAGAPAISAIKTYGTN